MIYKELFEKAQNDIKNCFWCIANGQMTTDLADDILNVAKELWNASQEDIKNADAEYLDTTFYIRDFLWAAEKLADAMNGFRDLKRDFIEN